MPRLCNDNQLWYRGNFGGIQNLNKWHGGGKSCRKNLNIHGNDVTITIYRLVPDYVVGRSTSPRWKKKFDPRCLFLIPTPPCMGLSTSCQLFKSCPAHCLCLRLPEWLPGDLRHSEQLVPWRAPCLSFCAVRCDLQHYQHNDGYQQCLGKAQEHIQGHDCIEATQFGIRCQCCVRGLTVHILVFGKVLQSTSCSRYWPEGCRSQLTS